MLPDAQKDALNARIPMGRMGEGSDIGAAVRLSRQPRCGYVTGADVARERRHGDALLNTLRATLLLLALAAPRRWPMRVRAQALACAVIAAPEGLDAQLAESVLNLDAERSKPALDTLHALVDRCAADQFLNDKERAAYFGYVLGRMARDGLDARLGAEGIPSALIDSALDIGPGNANNPATQVTARRSEAR